MTFCHALPGLTLVSQGPSGIMSYHGEAESCNEKPRLLWEWGRLEVQYHSFIKKTNIDSQRVSERKEVGGVVLPQ